MLVLLQSSSCLILSRPNTSSWSLTLDYRYSAILFFLFIGKMMSRGHKSAHKSKSCTPISFPNHKVFLPLDIRKLIKETWAILLDF